MRNHGTTILLVAALLIFTAPAMAHPPTPFVIDGHVYDFCGDPCNETWVRITNLNTGSSWNVENSSESNYYQLVPDSDNVGDRNGGAGGSANLALQSGDKPAPASPLRTERLK